MDQTLAAIMVCSCKAGGGSKLTSGVNGDEDVDDDDDDDDDDDGSSDEFEDDERDVLNSSDDLR